VGKLGYDFGSQAVGEVAGGLGGNGFEVDFEVVDFYGWHVYVQVFMQFGYKRQNIRELQRANILAI